MLGLLYKVSHGAYWCTGGCSFIDVDAGDLNGLSYPKLDNKPVGEQQGSWQGDDHLGATAQALPLTCRLTRALVRNDSKVRRMV